MTEPARTYSSMPKAARRAWMVPRWLKEAFVAFAVIAIAVVGVSKVLQNFWATWCPPCREEEPSLRQLAKAMDSRKFQLVAVSIDESGWPAIDEFFTGSPPPYDVLLDQMAYTSLKYGTTTLPESYLI